MWFQFPTDIPITEEHLRHKIFTYSSFHSLEAKLSGHSVTQTEKGGGRGVLKANCKNNEAHQKQLRRTEKPNG